MKKNKVDFLSETLSIDILLITETKIHISFPSVQFQIDRYTAPFCLDRNSNGRRILLYVREDNPSKVLDNTNLGSEIEAMFVEITLRKIKWLINFSYNPHKADIKTHLKALRKNLDLQSSKSESSEMAMNYLMDIYNLKN